jgi:hypothetical protein
MAIHVVTCIVSDQALKMNIHTPLFLNAPDAPVFSSGRVRVSITCTGVDRSTSPPDMMFVCLSVCNRSLSESVSPWAVDPSTISQLQYCPKLRRYHSPGLRFSIGSL